MVNYSSGRLIFLEVETLVPQVNYGFGVLGLRNTNGNLKIKGEKTMSIEKFLVKKKTKLQKILNRVVWKKHQDAIAEVCGKGDKTGNAYHYKIAIRETGKHSIKRIGEGAKAKPHTILEKSIKESSIKNVYGEENSQTKLTEFKRLDILGFVGYWRNNKLLGLYINEEEYKKIEDINKRNINASDFYTGDYDLHEVYGSNAKQIAEGSDDKVHLLNRLNASIARVDNNRKGTAVRDMKNHLISMKEGSEYAMFQHGDQATYITNQINEWYKNNRYGRIGEVEAVDVIATETDGLLGWCINGNWYVTQKKKEHYELRKHFGFITPHTWDTGHKRYKIRKKYN